MKKLLLLIMSFLFCVGVSAKVNYSQATNISNDYIKNFPNYQRFIITKNSSYGFNTSSNIVNAANFKTGGLINEQEFKVSSGSINRSYLFNGLTFFTMTEDGSNVKIIDPKVGSGITSINKAAGTSGVRVTNYVMKDVKVDGNGSRVSPWRFVDRYNVKFEYDDTKLTVRPGTATVPRGGWVEVDVIESAKYTYVPQTTCGVITNGKLRVTGITGDTTCKIDHTLREYTVTLDSGAGTFKNTVSTSLNYTLSESNTKATKKITYQTAIGTLPGASHVERIGYTLQEWLNGTTPVNASLKITEDTNLTANWKANEYTVTYNISCGTVSPSTITVTYDSKYGKEKSLDTPTNCTGYSFAGWYLDSGFGTRVTDDTIVSTPSNHTLYGKWSANTYTVTYNANGGSGTMQNSTPVFDDDFVTRKNTFTRSGFTFDGWNEASDGSGTKWTLSTPGVYEYENGSHKIKWTRAENVTLYAQWLKNVTAPTTTNYCSNPTYNGNSQSIVKTAGEGFTWSSNMYTDAGSYTAIATLKPGYIWSDGSKGTKSITCEIKKKATTITVTKQTVTYDGNTHTASGSADSGQTVSFEYYVDSSCNTKTSTSNGSASSGAAPKDVGTYYVKASTATNTNYLAGSGACTEGLVINAKSISVSWGTVTWTYDGSEHSTTATATTGVSNETMTLSISNNSITYKGTKSVTASCSSVSGGRAKCTNYTLTNTTNTLTVNAKAITITAKAQTITYGTAISKTTGDVTVATLGTGDTLNSITLTQSTTEVVTNGTITPSAAVIKKGSTDVTSSYTITYNTGKLVINAKSISVSWGTVTWTYDGSAHSTTATATTGVSGETMSLSINNNSITYKGTQSVTASCSSVTGGNAKCSNYTLTNTTNTLTINAKAITITAKAQTVNYGTAISKTTSDVTVATLASGDSLDSITLTQSTTNATSSGTITPSAAVIKKGSTNVTSSYSITYNTGTLVINGRAITVKATDQSKTWNGSALSADATCSVTSGSLLSGHTLTCTCTGSQTNAGTGTKTLSTVTIKDGSGNNVTGGYVITKQNGSLKVNKASSSVTCNNITYGSSTPIASCSGGSITGTYTNAGTYTVTCTGDSNHNNSSASCTINKADSIITCNNPTYGSGVAIASCSGGTINNPSTVAGTHLTSCTGDINHNGSSKNCTIYPSKTAVLGSCGTVYYDGSPHTLAGGGSHIGSYSNNTQTQVGTYTVTATAATNYAFSDGTTTKTLSCSIQSVPYNCKVISGVKKCCASGYTAYLASNGNDIECKISCTAGYHLATANASSCSACPAGTYSNANTVVYGGTSPCLECAAGTYASGTANASCTKCSQGYYASGTKNTSCTPCAAGYHGPLEGLASCTICPAGTYATGTGNKSCTFCYYGSYASGTGNTSCTKCSAGTYQDGAGQASCKSCPAGQYNTGTGNTSCKKCDAGDYASGTGNTSCEECGAGTYSSAGASSCTQCPAGKYASGTGNSSCTACPAGRYSSSAGWSSCSKCAAGKYASGTGNTGCSNCPAGKYASGTGNSSCTCCGAGTYASGTGNSGCKSCASGYTSSSCAGSCTKQSSGGGGGGCFLAGTKVKTLLGDKDINELFIGEEILTYNENSKTNEYKKIVDIFTFKDKKEVLYTLTFDNKSKLSLTRAHRVYVDRNGKHSYIAAEEIVLGDIVLFSDGTTHIVTKVSHKNIVKTVYNLQLEGNHNFYVGEDGVLVHNMFLQAIEGK